LNEEVYDSFRMGRDSHFSGFDKYVVSAADSIIKTPIFKFNNLTERNSNFEHYS
jgi:hypothetical protein